MPQIKAIRIPADQEAPVELVEYDRDDYKFIQDAVGGWYDAVSGADGVPITFWVNDEGKNRGLPVNKRGTLLLYVSNERFIDRDVLCGDVLVTGPPDGEGNSLSIHPTLEELVFKTEQYCIEVQTGSDAWASNAKRYESYWDALLAAYDLSSRWTLVTAWRASAVAHDHSS